MSTSKNSITKNGKTQDMEEILEQNYIAKETINRTNGTFDEKQIFSSKDFVYQFSEKTV